MDKIKLPYIPTNSPKIAFATLGCKVNQYETQLLREKFEKIGFTPVPFSQEADIYLINTCTVTQRADRKSRELIAKARKRKRGACLIVTGCYAEAESKKLEESFPGLNFIIGNKDKLKIPQFFGGKENKREAFSSIRYFYGHNRAFIKIEDGCNQFCSYCRIPYVRGEKIKSRSIKDILSEIKNLISSGFKEIVLTGVNLGLYGKDRGASLVDLLKEIELLQGEFRVRLSSLEPHLLTKELVTFMAESLKICPHLHLPLQSGDAYILERMGRKYSPSQYQSLVEIIREEIPFIGLSTDVMVGFPGEEEEHFLNTLHFVQRIGFNRIHIFTFSPRPGTRAYSMRPLINEEVKRRRAKRLREIAKNSSRKFISRFLGNTLEVLVEGRDNSKEDLLSGYTENYIRVFLKGDEKLENKIVRVKLTEAYEGWAQGELV
ncbi:tRNA (N(6)-L-threonylcarbamoyladenosine(37)-C(2))-methylthiotransferase MtaB [Candidatus Aerophobetes bacterium]|nr:tRNA (N(6)-L-threonylcarbamoyladenosine(37)-C(2))-methylthiotransferase MtaB [Candidatus Aerophobetes bacterium]